MDEQVMKIKSQERRREETEEMETETAKKEAEYQSASLSMQHLACWLWLSSLWLIFTNPPIVSEMSTQRFVHKIYNTLNMQHHVPIHAWSALRDVHDALQQ